MGLSGAGSHLDLTANSTILPLEANAIYTGTFEEVSAHAFISFSVFADQASATDGLKFQWSSDGTHVDRIEITTVKAGIGRAFSITVRARYFRIQYVNGPVAQTEFRLNTVYHQSGTGIITKPLNGSVDTENFAQLVQSATLGKIDSENFKNIGAYLNSTEDYSLKVYDKETVAKLDEVISSLGGQVTSADPVQFSVIAPGGKKLKKKDLIDAANNALMIDAEVPTGKKWYITSWDGSGQGKGYYKYTDYDPTTNSYFLIDNMDAITGWTIREKVSSLTLDTAVKYEGTGSVKVVGNAPKSTDKIRIDKTYLPVLDLSAYDEIGIWCKASHVSKLLKLKLYEGADKYEYSGTTIQDTEWHSYTFPLSEIPAAVDLTKIDKIEIIILSNGRQVTGDIFNLDLIQKCLGYTESEIDFFFAGAYIPHQHLFPTAIPIVAGHHVRVYVANEEGSSKYYEVGVGGREVTL